MKKTIFLMITLSVALLSCNNNKGYMVNGVVADSIFDGQTVYLKNLDMQTIDSAQVTKGKFTMKSDVDSTFFTLLFMEGTTPESRAVQIPLLVEPGVINVDIKKDVVLVTGTPANENYSKLRAMQSDVNKELSEIMGRANEAQKNDSYTDEMQSDLREQYGKIIDKADSITYDFFINNINNGIGQYLFSKSATMFSVDKQRAILDKAPSNYKSTPSAQKILKSIEVAEKVAVGQKFVDLKMKNLKGIEISLSDYVGKGKVVLIDFWASWCGPCRQEMPNVVAAYAKYKNKGFEIVGVSLDKDANDWAKGTKELKITWPQMSDLGYWQSKAAATYAVRSIPHTVLVDKDGIIIAKDLRGADLDAKLGELLGK